MRGNVKLTPSQISQLFNYLKSTYTFWHYGNDLRTILLKVTYYRHRKALAEYGINIDLPSTHKKSNVIPLIRVLEAKPATIPQWAYDLKLIHHSAYKRKAS